MTELDAITTARGQSPVADHVRKIPRSGIRDFFEIVQSMHDVISLGIGEPDFITPWHIREAAIYSLERGRTGYTSNLGLPTLRKEISRHLKDRIGVEYDPASEILVAVGVSEALDLALRAVINPGDEIIYHEPCYVSYHPSVALAHGKPVAIPTREENGFALNPSDVESAITPQTKALVLNFPTNPTGAAMSMEALEQIARIVCERNLIVITDDIYTDLAYNGSVSSIVQAPGMRERTIYLNGFSKAYAMTGFRIGYACAPMELTEAMMRVHQYSMLCASITSQDAAFEALRAGEPERLRMRDSYLKRRNFLFRRLRDMGLPCVEPQGAFYLFPSIRSTGLGSREFAMRLLEVKNVAVVPGNAFGPSGEGYVRCSYATSLEKLEIAADRIEAFISKTLASSSTP